MKKYLFSFLMLALVLPVAASANASMSDRGPSCGFGDLFNRFTGARCAASSYTPPGCTSMTNFSSITGERCPNVSASATTTPDNVLYQTYPSACYSFNQDLTVGSSGADVAKLVDVLMRENFFKLPEMTGDEPGYHDSVEVPRTQFSEYTASAVVRFQAKYGIRQTGYVGPMTRAKLNSLCNSVPTAYRQSYLKVISPNGGELFRAGESHVISWQSSGVGRVNIDLCGQSRTIGRVCHQIARGVSASAGYYNWNTDPNDPFSGLNADYVNKVFISAADINSGVNDESDSGFALVDADAVINTNSAASIELIQPIGGENYKADGEPAVVEWKSKNLGNYPIEIDFLDKTGRIVKQFTNIKNTGSYAWNVSTIPSGDYTVLVGTQAKEGAVGSASARSGTFKVSNTNSNNPVMSVRLRDNGVSLGNHDIHRTDRLEISWTVNPTDDYTGDYVDLVYASGSKAGQSAAIISEASDAWSANWTAGKDVFGANIPDGIYKVRVGLKNVITGEKLEGDSAVFNLSTI